MVFQPFRRQTSDLICQHEESRSSLFFYFKTRGRFLNSHAKCILRVSSIFKSLLFVVRTSAVAPASKELSNNDHFHPLLFAIIIFNMKSSHFLLSKINKLDRDFLHGQIFSLVCPLSACKDWKRSQVSWIRSITWRWYLFPISYGDRIPKSPCGRLVCFTWIIMGLIMVTCFNSTMTSLLTARILDKEVSLYGTKVC